MNKETHASDSKVQKPEAVRLAGEKVHQHAGAGGTGGEGGRRSSGRQDTGSGTDGVRAGGSNLTQPEMGEQRQNNSRFDGDNSVGDGAKVKPRKPIKASPALLAMLKAEYERGAEKYTRMLDALRPSRRDFVMMKHGRRKLWLSELRHRIVLVEETMQSRK